MPIQYLSVIVAFVICAGALPAVKILARRLHLYDAPGPLKIHHGSIPRLGGIAMMLGLLGSIIAFHPPAFRMYGLPLLVLAAVWAVGLLDDLMTVPSSIRFCVHIVAGAAFWLGGWRLSWFQASTLDLAATCVLVALVINAMNFLDGMDGLAAGTTAVISLGFLVVSVHSADLTGTLLASSLLGISVGMLTANAPPATIFMGDSGSTLIGVVLAFLSLNWIHVQPAGHTIVVPLIFLSIPLADVAFAVTRRARSGSALFAGDRRHYYDLLLGHGWSVPRILEVSLGINCVLGIVAWFCARGILGMGFGIAIVVSFGIAASAYFLGSLQPEPEQVQDNHQVTPITSALEQLEPGDANVNV